MDVCKRLSVPTVAALALAGTVACADPAVAPETESSYKNPYIEELAEALGPLRLFEPRLSGGFQWGECVKAEEDPEDLIPSALCGSLEPGSRKWGRVWRIWVGIQQALDQGETAELLHAQGVAYLLWGNLDHAVISLEKSLMSPGLQAPQIKNDLGVAYLIRAGGEDNPLDLFSASKWLERALSKEPPTPESNHNYALVAEYFHARSSARAAWNAVLEVADTDSWREEARGHLDALKVPTLREEFDEEKTYLDHARIPRAVQKFPLFMSRLVEEEVLPTWGRAWLAGDEEQASESLAKAETIGLSLAEDCSDSMAIDTVKSIQRVMNDPGLAQCLPVLADALSAYGESMAHYRALDFEAATSGLEKVIGSPTQCRSPISGLALFYRAVITHYSDPVEAEGELESLAEYPDKYYPILGAYRRWMLGTNLSNQGLLKKSLSLFNEALDLLDNSLGSQGSAFVHILLAERLSWLGLEREAWEHRLRSFSVLSRLGDYRRYHAALHESIDSLQRQDIAPTATVLVTELFHNAEAWGQPGALAEAHIRLAVVRLNQSEFDTALAHLNAARKYSTSLPKSEPRARLESNIDLTYGEVQAASNPLEAIEEISAAIKDYQHRDYRYPLPQAFRTLAQAELTVGHISDAEVDLGKAIAEIERSRGQVESLQEKASVSTRAQDAYDAMILLQWQQNGNLERAFEYADLSKLKFQSLTDSAEGKLGASSQGGIKTVFSVLTPKTVILEYAVLDDYLLAWRLNAGHLNFYARPISSDFLVGLVETYQQLLQSGYQADLDEMSQYLFDLLLRAPLADLSSDHFLVIIPDGPLRVLPFSTLKQPGTGEYLIENYALAVAPAASILRPGYPTPRGGKGSDRLLLVGSGSGGQGLTGAAAEIQLLRELYGEDVTYFDSEHVDDVQLLDSLDTFKVFHYSGHAGTGVEPGGSFLQLGRDKKFVVSELLKRPFKFLSLVVLSACETAEPISRHSPRVGGIGEGFLLSGVPQVVASLWPVNDRATQSLMYSFHVNLRKGVGASEALRMAQVGLLRQGKGISLPVDWGAFLLLTNVIPTEDNVVNPQGKIQ